MANIVIGGTGAKGAGKSGGKGGNKGGGKAANPFKGLTPGMQALTDPTQAALSGQNLIDAAHAVANAQTVGPLGEAARQIAQTNRGTRASERLTGGYFTQFGKSAQQGVADEAKIGSDLQTQLQGIGANTQSALTGIGQDAQSAVQKYMPAGDQSLSSPAMQSLTAEIARQRGYASQYGQIGQTSGALQSANYGGMAAAEKGIGAAAGTQALGELARAGRLAVQPLTSKEATLDQTRGALYANALSQIRQQGTTNLLTEQGLGNTAAGIAATSANEAANRTATATNERLNRQFTAGQNRLDRQGRLKQERIIQSAENRRATARKTTAAGKPVTAPQLTPYEQQHLKADLGRAIAFVQKGKTKGVAADKILLDGPAGLGAYYDPTLLQAALEVVQGNGTITAATAQSLRQMGLRGLTWSGNPITVRRGVGGAVTGTGGSPSF